MPKFTYSGHDTSGTAVENTVEAEDRFAVYAIARDEGHTIDSVHEQSVFSLQSWLNVDKINQFLSR